MFQKIRRFFADTPHPAETCQPQKDTPEQIIERLEREVAEGNVDSMFQLGSIYFSGEGVQRDPSCAKEWFEKAAAEGNTAAMRNLAVMYTTGDGVEKDPAVANQRFARKAKPCSAKGPKCPRLR
ncbi:MAG: hypothetical protein ALMCE001_04030 [Methanocorpusculum sp. MCE]|nr:MAG: hypothetical protein ALMCE001_04030 [Methanocorpusculum sp. MCE]